MGGRDIIHNDYMHYEYVQGGVPSRESTGEEGLEDGQRDEDIGWCYHRSNTTDVNHVLDTYYHTISQRREDTTRGCLHPASAQAHTSTMKIFRRREGREGRERGRHIKCVRDNYKHQ